MYIRLAVRSDGKGIGIMGDTTLHGDTLEYPIQPEWDGNVPNCAMYNCGSYDGKRCMATGFRPDSICEPATENIVHAAKAAAVWFNSSEEGFTSDIRPDVARTLFFRAARSAGLEIG